MNNRGVYIVWSRIYRRPKSMQGYFCFEIKLFPLCFSLRILRPLEYAIKVVTSLYFLFREKPGFVWIHCAPTFTLYYAHFYKLFYPDVSIIVDCHNSAFRDPWINLPGVRSLLNSSTAVLVHNEEVRTQGLSRGVKNEKLFILEDRSPSFPLSDLKSIVEDGRRPYVLFACSFDQDEPLEVVFNSAKLLPNVLFRVTGDHSRAAGMHNISEPPSNIKLTGFLSLGEYNNLLLNASVALCLTTREGVQLCVANEAVGAEIPMVMSKTRILQKLFNQGVIFVDTLDAVSIASGIEEALANRSSLVAGVKKMKQERDASWLSQAENVRAGVARNISEVKE